MTCTWTGCTDTAVHPQLGRDGAQWANLCSEHHQLLRDCQQSEDPKRILSSWVKAQGGAKVAARRLS